MEVIDYIFLLSLLSIGYGKYLYPRCTDSTVPHLDATYIPSNHSVELTYPKNRTRLPFRQSCYWRIQYAVVNQEIHIIFKEFHLIDSFNCKEDSLEIRFPGYDIDKNMKFCGTSYPKELQLNSNEKSFFDIVLHSNSQDIDLHIIIKNDAVLTYSRVSELTVGNNPMYIYSPGYPDNYYKYLNMTWNFTAKEPTKRIMLEFLWFKSEDSRLCDFDFLQVEGEKSHFHTCGYKSRFLVAANDSNVRMTFESDGTTEYDGFVVKYYTVPYPDYEESCVKGGLRLTAIPFIPQLITVTKTNEKDCSWNIEPDVNNTDHVIVFEIVSYLTSTFKCDQRLYVTDRFTNKLAADYFKIYTPPGNIVSEGGTVSNCINKAVQYYRSMNSAITVRLVDSTPTYSSVIGNVTFSYYSVPRELYLNDVIHIGYRPSYIWLFNPLYKPDQYDIILKADSGCIMLELLDERMKTYNIDIKEYIKIYDGDSDDAQDLINGCDENRNGSIISGTKPYMFIKIRNQTAIHPQPTLLEVRSTDQCQGFMKKIVIPSSSNSVKIYSPNYPSSVPRNLVCHYEVSAYEDDSVLNIQGRTDTRLKTCNDKVNFYHLANKFYTWCFITAFAKETSFNKIRFTLETDHNQNIISYSVLVTEIRKPKVSTELPPGHCNGHKTLKPQAGQTYTITSPNYPQDYPINLHCEWLIIAPGGYEISLTIKPINRAWSQCSDTLKLYNGRDAWIEFKVFDYCEEYPNVRNTKFKSNGAVFLLEFGSGSYFGDAGFKATYTLIKAESIADLPLTLHDQTFRFESSWEISGTHLQRRFIKPSNFYVNYRIVLYITGVDGKFCRTGSISYTNVILNSEFYEKLHLCDVVQSYTTLYGPYDNVTMDIYVAKDGPVEPYFVSIVYLLEKIPDCSPGRPLLLFAEERVITFTSPNYPGHYDNNQYCQWKILASKNYVLQLEVIFSQLGYSSNANYRDYVAIYDGGDRYSTLLGKFTGSTRVIYKSTSDVVFIEFYSDASDTNTGFEIEYQKVKSGHDSVISDSKDYSTEVIAGCIAAVVVVFVCCIICGVCFKRKRTNCRRQSSTSRSTSQVYNTANNTVYFVPHVISNNTYPTSLPPPSYSELDDLGFTSPLHPGAPPAYSELPSYEDSKQYEIPNSRSLSSNDTLNNITQLEISRSGQIPDSQEDVTFVQGAGSQDELHNHSVNQLRGIDNPALSRSTSSIV